MGLLDYEPTKPLKEKFDYHTLVLTLVAGEGEGITFKVECRGAGRDDCACRSGFCLMKETIDGVGLEDILRSAGDIELARLSARMDYTDYDEPWVEVEP